MNKRKLDINLDLNELIKNNEYKIFNYFNNPINCDKIVLCNNHIYYDALVNKESIDTLMLYINTIIGNFQSILKTYNKTIYLHINSKGGFLENLLCFINFKNKLHIEIISIIEKECADIAIIMASICDYRIINKNAHCKLSKYQIEGSNPNYWNYFKQFLNESMSILTFKNTIYHLLCNSINSKITKEKLDKYFEKDSFWDAKKYKKIGLADEIV